MNNSVVLKGISVGDVITAELLNNMTRAINRNAKGFSKPRSEVTPANALVGAGGGGLTDLTFTETSRTESTRTITDSTGDTSTINVIDQVVLQNAALETLTLNFTNP